VIGPDRLADALADRYRIERELGQGGMATVYLADDLKHDRKVAIKVLKPELAAVLGAARFVQEIKTTAALSHPHILPLFDSGEVGGFLFYVMPYIQGETIRDKLNRETQLGIKEAVKIAAEVADALDYAHRHGVIHRDIKPENILLHDRRPMVMDFGIALAVSAAAGGRMTETGLSLGTPHYMSPEQATADRDITARSDVYSLASVLYEMLAGEPPHMGNSAQQIIMKIIAEDARPVTELRRTVPPNVAAAVGKALEKLPADRFSTAHQFATALHDASFRAAIGGGSPAASAAAAVLTPRTALVAAAALAVGFLAHALLVRNQADPALVARVSIPLDSGVRFTGPGANAGRPIFTELALSPDGRTLVFSARGADGTRRLFARAMDASSATPIEGTEGGDAPIFSPRGDQVAFWSRSRLRRVPLAGGTPVDVVTFTGDFNGASWGDDDYIVFRDDGRTGLARVSAAGGGAVVALPSHPDAALPQVLPGSKAVLYTVRYGAAFEERRVEALRLGETRTDTIVDDASDARYLPTGHLLFARAGSLMARSFDPDRLRASGSATGVLPDVMHAMNGWNTGVWTNAAQYAISAAGHLAYLTGGVTPTERNQVVWLDRTGRVTDLGLDPAWYLLARIAPTGDRLAVAAPGATGGVWTVDLGRGNAVRRIASGQIAGLLWTRDGRGVVYWAESRGSFRVAADRSTPAEVLDSATVWPAEATPDGRDLIYIDQSSGIPRIGARMFSSGERRVLVEEPAGTWYPTLSPDGRWLAYALVDGSELVVRSWPDLERRTVIAGPGVSEPAWSRGGRELFYQQPVRAATGELIPALVVRSFDPDTGRPVGDSMTISLPRNYRSMGPVRAYDVTADGRRIVAILQNADVSPLPRQIELVLNWASTMKRPRD
jgi:serine/threonine-protein kinase